MVNQTAMLCIKPEQEKLSITEISAVTLNISK